MKKLHWDNDQETQESGIKEAEKLKDIKPLIQPMDYGSKAVWDNCAIVLVQKSDHELEPYLKELLEWIQDLNWPGALAILDRLKKFNTDKIKYPFETAIEEAKRKNDINWLFNLSYILNNNDLELKIDSKYTAIISENNKDYY